MNWRNLIFPSDCGRGAARERLYGFALHREFLQAADCWNGN